MSLYYQYMETYMGPALFAVSTHSGLHPKPRGSDFILYFSTRYLNVEFVNWQSEKTNRVNLEHGYMQWSVGFLCV